MKRLTADVIVVGAGAAGLAAAVTAAEAGAKVVLLEKRSSPGAISFMLSVLGLMRSDPAFRDRAFRVWMDSTHWTANASLVRAMIDKASQFQEWLAKYGIHEQLNPQPWKATSLETMGRMRGIGGGWADSGSIFDWYFCDTIKDERAGKGPSGPIMLSVLVEEAKRLGVDVRMSTPARKILKEKDEIVGVIAEEPSGETIQVDARAVIIATNGFHEDKRTVKELGFDVDMDGYGIDGDLSIMVPDRDLTGDGMRMASEVGADRGPLGFSLCYNVPNPGINGRMPWTVMNQTRIVQDQPYLWVNQSGRRFIDEDMSSDRITMANVLAKQRPKCGYLIFDDDTRAQLEKNGPEWCYFVFTRMLPLVDIQGQFKEMIELGNKNVFLAGSLEELSQQTGIDRTNLENTIAEYNGYCEKGHDDMFAKNPKFLRPVRKPTFYALRNTVWTYESLGGIRINERGEALTADLNAIPGLFAAGSVAVGELFGNSLDSAYGLVTLAWALGCIAGESALQRVQI